jgi:hypothetical protein
LLGRCSTAGATLPAQKVEHFKIKYKDKVSLQELIAFNRYFIFLFHFIVSPDNLYKIYQIKVEKQIGYFDQAEGTITLT